MKRFLFIFLVMHVIFSSCSQNTSIGPGYRWDLFKKTPSWALAEAVAKEDTNKIFSIINEGKVDINFQEPRFRKTLLMLAVGNDKLLSTAALLKMKADVSIRDNEDDQAIHEAVSYIDLKKHSLDILKLLLQYHADVNSISKEGNFLVPLQGAISDINCAKLLVDNGANPYVKTPDSTFVVWSSLNDAQGDQLQVAKYFIMEKKLPIPDPILYTYPDHEPRDIYQLFSLIDFYNNSEKEIIRNNIVKYLRSIDFPKNQCYKQVESPKN